MVQEPETGIHITTYLDNKVYKVRLASKSKGKGKSGGFRVITYLVKKTGTNTKIVLISIYDKSEDSTLNKSRIIKLLKEIF